MSMESESVNAQMQEYLCAPGLGGQVQDAKVTTFNPETFLMAMQEILYVVVVVDVNVLP
jgi:hypothetical protein